MPSNEFPHQERLSKNRGHRFIEIIQDVAKKLTLDIAVKILVFLLTCAFVHCCAMLTRKTPSYQTKTWQLTEPEPGYAAGDAEHFLWARGVLRPSDRGPGVMELDGLADGPLFVLLNGGGPHPVYCGDHDQQVFWGLLEFRRGNFVRLSFRDMHGTPDRDCWFLLQDLSRKDSAGNLPRDLYTTVHTN